MVELHSLKQQRRTAELLRLQLLQEQQLWQLRLDKISQQLANQNQALINASQQLTNQNQANHQLPNYSKVLGYIIPKPANKSKAFDQHGANGSEASNCIVQQLATQSEASIRTYQQLANQNEASIRVNPQLSNRSEAFGCVNPQLTNQSQSLVRLSQELTNGSQASRHVDPQLANRREALGNVDQLPAYQNESLDQQSTNHNKDSYNQLSHLVLPKQLHALTQNQQLESQQKQQRRKLVHNSKDLDMSNQQLASHIKELLFDQKEQRQLQAINSQQLLLSHHRHHLNNILREKQSSVIRHSHQQLGKDNI